MVCVYLYKYTTTKFSWIIHNYNCSKFYSFKLIVYCVIFCRLTAFVLRVLCEAQKYHHVDEQIMCSGVRYILSKQQPDGAFGDDSPIYHKEMLVRSVPSAWCTIQIQMCYARLESILWTSIFFSRLLISGKARIQKNFPGGTPSRSAHGIDNTLYVSHCRQFSDILLSIFLFTETRIIKVHSIFSTWQLIAPTPPTANCTLKL